ncbi:MAG: SpoIIE family protein phosphatase [Deltaproteobacteria bacterium]|nr:SpoIIE family protein phosphatase [Deltaproteobacteria bacterium]
MKKLHKWSVSKSTPDASDPASVAGAGARRALAAPLPQTERQRILYVEDVPENWEVTELVLKRRFAMQWAKNDQEACAILAESGKELAAVLMDIELKGSHMDGIELTKLARGTLPEARKPKYAKAVPLLDKLPIIFVTGYGARYSEDELKAVGGDLMLPKPVNFAALSTALSNLAVKRKPGAAAEPARHDTAELNEQKQLVKGDKLFENRFRALTASRLFSVTDVTKDPDAVIEELGIDGVEAVTMALSVLDLVKETNPAVEYLLPLVLRRAVTASLVCNWVRDVDLNFAVAAGFLMDAGLLARAMHDPTGALEIGLSPSKSRPIRERAANEVEHGVRVMELATDWDVPHGVVEAVLHHHDDEPPGGEPLALVAWVVERIAAMFEPGDVEQTRQAAFKACDLLGIARDGAEQLFTAIPEGVARVAKTCGLPVPPQVTYRELMGHGNVTLTNLARSYDDLQNTLQAIIQEKLAMTQLVEAGKKSLEAAYKKDMALIAAVQEMFQPKHKTMRAEGLVIHGFCRAADECGGDWWWFDDHQGSVRVAVGDVSGHGPGPAMVTAATESVYRILRRMMPELSVEEQLKEMHDELLVTAQGHYHMTMSLLDMPHDESVIHWWNGGAPMLLVLDPDRRVQGRAVRGTPLALAPELQIGHLEIPKLPGTRIFMFTDGLYEFEAIRKTKATGIRALRAFLLETAGMGIEDAAKHIMDQVDRLRPEDTPQEDDMTMLLVDVVE